MDLDTDRISASEVQTLDQLVGVATPVLIGFVATLIGLVVSNSGEMRWPDATVACLMLAALSLVLAIRMYLSGRPHLLTVEEIAERGPTASDEQKRLAKRTQDERYRTAATRARVGFHVGIAALFLGIAGVLLPPCVDILDANAFRLAAVAIALLGSLVMAIWGLREERRARKAAAEHQKLEKKLNEMRTREAEKKAAKAKPATPEK